MAVSTVHHFVIEPGRGVGPIRFGMHKDEVSHAFTYIYRSFFKVSDSKVRSDQCGVVGLIIHYDDASRVNFIEMTKAQHATVTWELLGRDITGISLRGLVEFLRSLSFKAETIQLIKLEGYAFPQLGIRTYNSALVSDDDAIECLGLGMIEREMDADVPAI
jgi:hypothetical protein